MLKEKQRKSGVPAIKIMEEMLLFVMQGLRHVAVSGWVGGGGRSISGSEGIRN